VQILLKDIVVSPSIPCAHFRSVITRPLMYLFSPMMTLDLNSSRTQRCRGKQIDISPVKNSGKKISPRPSRRMSSTSLVEGGGRTVPHPFVLADRFSVYG
jgi:hypothetical protein